MSKFIKKAASAILASVMAISMVVSVAAAQPSWATENYNNAYITRSCSFKISGVTFEGVMGLFAGSPHGKVVLETGTSSSVSGATYTTSAYCKYVDSSGNTQTYSPSGTTKLSFYAMGTGQMFQKINGTHYVVYNSTKNMGTTIYG